MVVWDVNDGAGDSQDCWGQRFAADGTRVGSAFRINTTTTGYQYNAAIATTDGGRILATWTGTGPGDSPDGIFAQRYEFVYSDAGGISNASSMAITIKNSIVANNTSSHSVPPDVAGAFSSLGGNLVGDDSSSYGITQPSDKVGSIESPLDPELGPLADNGGPTKTHLPAADSPAIDAGISTGLPTPPSVDQRGVDRPKDGNNSGGQAEFDIGAVDPLLRLDQPLLPKYARPFL